MKDVISVIVPVYNVSAYLPECLDSILSQDYEKLEVILIDDGSTDDSGAICDAYAQRDGRIRVIHQKNGGAADMTLEEAFIAYIEEVQRKGGHA